VAHTVQLDRMFQDVKFFKPGSEIAEKALAKVLAIRAQITDREERMTAICAQHSLGPGDLFALPSRGATTPAPGVTGEVGEAVRTRHRCAICRRRGQFAGDRVRADRVERQQVRTLELLAATSTRAPTTRSASRSWSFWVLESVADRPSMTRPICNRTLPGGTYLHGCCPRLLTASYLASSGNETIHRNGQ